MDPRLHPPREEAHGRIPGAISPYSGKGWITLGLLGVLVLLTAAWYPLPGPPAVWLTLALSTISAAIIGHARGYWSAIASGAPHSGPFLHGLYRRGVWAWLLGLGLTVFYMLLYWFPALLGLGTEGRPNHGLIALFDPLSQLIKREDASQWFVYGVLYTLAVLTFGIRFLYKYRQSPHQRRRTWSVMGFQFFLAFLIPEILLSLRLPYADLKHFWPLNYSFFFEWNLKALLDQGLFGHFVLLWGIIGSLVLTPVLTWFYGKRWYCSWVCGCGGLAETAGDPFRHLADPSLRAWRIERWMIYSVLVLVVLMTGMVLYTWFTGITRLGWLDTYMLQSWYGFLIGAAFSGVIGVGFYPLMGARVWCRFGCPMAAIMGLQQRYLSRFRITTNGGQCISCGQCTRYCEMGIDVRAYAQRGQDILRASCVGCGICAEVCPRGVLRLENKSGDISLRGMLARNERLPDDLFS